jgi:Zn-dependent protease with chaperone function
MVIKTVRGKTEDYKDEELIKSLEDIEDFHGLEFELKKYSGEKSFNAFVIPPIPFFRKKYTISFGEELIESFTLGEKLFVIAHEIAHAIDKHVHKRALLFFLVFFLLLVFSLLLNIFVIKNAVEYFVQFYLLYNLVLLLIGIIGIDLVSWRYEYKADEKALELTKDFTSFKSAFLKFEEKKPARDFGKIINLIVYDHPLIKNRIEKRKLLIEGK